MNWIKKVIYAISLSLFVIPTVAISDKPNYEACPCEGYWTWGILGIDCLQDDPELITRGGWPSPSPAPDPISEIALDGLKSDSLELQLSIGVREVDGDIYCSFSVREEIEDGVYIEEELFFPNPLTDLPLTVDEARNCVFFNRSAYDIIVESDWYCE